MERLCESSTSVPRMRAATAPRSFCSGTAFRIVGVSPYLPETAGRSVKRLGRRAIEALPVMARQRALLAAEGGMYRWPFYRPLARPGRRQLLMTYDLRCSAPSFGDFMQFALVARLYQLRGLQTRIVVIDGELRDDHVALGPDVVADHGARAEQYPEIAKAVSLVGWSKSSGCRTPSSPRGRARSAEEWAVTPCGETSSGGEASTHNRGAMLEHICGEARPPRGSASPSRRRRWGPISRSVRRKGDYLTVAVRAASVAGHDRDITAAELEGWLERIRAHFLAEPVWIVSDDAGTEAVRSWGLDFGLRYAQDFGRGFAAHTLLALGSRGTSSSVAEGSRQASCGGRPRSS